MLPLLLAPIILSSQLVKISLYLPTLICIVHSFCRLKRCFFTTLAILKLAFDTFMNFLSTLEMLSIRRLHELQTLQLLWWLNVQSRPFACRSVGLHELWNSIRGKYQKQTKLSITKESLKFNIQITLVYNTSNLYHKFIDYINHDLIAYILHLIYQKSTSLIV